MFWIDDHRQLSQHLEQHPILLRMPDFRFEARTRQPHRRLVKSCRQSVMFAPNSRDEGEALPPVPSLTAVSTGQPYPARRDGHAPDGIHTPKSLSSRGVFAGRGGAVVSQQSGELLAPGSEERNEPFLHPSWLQVSVSASG